MTGYYLVALAKEDFKFSAAHFTIFSETVAERLHGHNYRVKVEVRGEGTDDLGLLLNLENLKAEIRRACVHLDGKTLVPGRCPLLTAVPKTGGVELSFDDRRYRLPEADTLVLPIANVTLEELAFYLWGELSPSLTGGRATELAVEVEETPGQSCRYRAPLQGSVLAETGDLSSAVREATA